MLGKSRESYSQKIVELGLTCKASGLTSHQAVTAMRAFLCTDTEKKEQTKDKFYCCDPTTKKYA